MALACARPLCVAHLHLPEISACEAHDGNVVMQAEQEPSAAACCACLRARPFAEIDAISQDSWRAVALSLRPCASLRTGSLRRSAETRDTQLSPTLWGAHREFVDALDQGVLQALLDRQIPPGVLLRC